MRILAIETSCDETAAAIIEAKPGHKKIKVLSSVVSSSLKLHAKTGGIIPEVAARQQIKYIIPVIEQAIIEMGSKKWESGNRSGKLEDNIDAIAITIGPGLIGSLLIGVETAKTLAFAWNKPIIPVNHLLAHVYANFIENLTPNPYALNPKITFPFIGLIVSGGHTDLLLFKSHKNYKWLGGTRDDAAGEALDKIARILGLSYPGGPEIEKRALKGNAKAFNFPRPMIDSEDFDFSFSGLKTAVLREVQTMKQLSNETISDLCASVQQAIVDVLVKKTIRAAKLFNISTIVLGGGVTANEYLRSQFLLNARRYLPDVSIFFPDKKYTTDNAAMIATTAFFQYKEIPWSKITANPELYFD